MGCAERLNLKCGTCRGGLLRNMPIPEEEQNNEEENESSEYTSSEADDEAYDESDEESDVGGDDSDVDDLMEI